jgi:putative colanic acid biosynthesis glycosyltransferase WcaI
LQIGLLSQWYEPEPWKVPSVLARELGKRGHTVKVLTGFPNYPEGRIYDGYQIAWRLDSTLSGAAVRRVALFPSHGRSPVGRLANYGSFAATASLWGSGFLKGVEGLWVYNSPPSVGLPTWVIKARYRPRVVLHIMDIWPESLMASGFGSILKWQWLEQALDKWLLLTYRHADSIACSSRTQIELLAHRGVARAKLSYVPIWVDEGLFYPMEPDLSLAADLGVKDKTILLYAGAIGEPQGLDPLVEVCGRLRDEPSFHCLIAGSGAAEPRLRARAEALRLSNVSFLGRWPINNMNRLMSIGDVHLVSLRADPLAEVAMPSKVPATLACGKPIIAAAQGEAAAVVLRSAAGWACPPGDQDGLEAAVREALAVGAGRLREMGGRARRAYEAEFAVDIGVERVEQLLVGANLKAKYAG